jgi:hypothetical protein
VFCHTTHTHAGRTGAEHYNSHHEVLIGAIISTLNDLSMQIHENLLFERSGLGYSNLGKNIFKPFPMDVFQFIPKIFFFQAEEAVSKSNSDHVNSFGQ